MFKYIFLFFFAVVTTFADDGTAYFPPSPNIPLNCTTPSSQIRSVTINELFSGGGGGGNLEFIEIYFNETTNIQNWRLYFNDSNTHKYANLGTGLGEVHYPNGTVGADNLATYTYPKGSYIIYEFSGMDPSDGEIFIANTQSSLTGGSSVVVDYFNYYKNRETTYYTLTDAACKITLADMDSNGKDISRLTDGSGDFYQYYPGTTTLIEHSEGGTNLDNLPPNSSLTANVSISADFNQTQAYIGSNVTLTLKVTNPPTGSITVTDVNVTSLIPSGLSYVSNNGGILSDSLLPSNPFGTVTSTAPEFDWRLINGSVILSLTTDSVAYINIVLKVTADTPMTVYSGATLATKQQNIGTKTSSASLIIARAPPANCTTFGYDLYHISTPSAHLHTRIANLSFDVNATVACTDSGVIPPRTIKKIYAVSGACPTTTAGLPILWSGSSDINDSIRTVTLSGLNSLKAYSNIKLMLETNASELNCSTDTMAIRPSSFSLSAASIKAGENINVVALGGGSGYSGGANVTTALNTANTACATQNNFLSTAEPKSLAFVADINSSTLVGKDIGNIDVFIADKTWTIIDQLNGDCVIDSNSVAWSGLGGKVGCDINSTLPLSITPYKLNTTRNSFALSSGSNWLYLDSSRTQNVEVNATIRAYDKDGILISKNFSDGCSGSGVGLGFYFTTVGTASVDVNTSLISTTGSVNLIKDINASYITVFNNQYFLVPNTSFKDGDANLSLKFNFLRSNSTPVNPFILNLTDINTSYGSSVIDRNASGLSNGATFVYGRIHPYDIITDQQIVPNPVEIEIYGKNSSNVFLDGKPQNVLYWYRNTNHDDNLSGSILLGNSYDTNITITTNTPPLDGINLIDIQYSKTVPIQKTIYLNIPQWLWYSRDGKSYVSAGVDCATKPCFNYNFVNTGTTLLKGVNSGVFEGSDFQMIPSKNTTYKGVKLFR